MRPAPIRDCPDRMRASDTALANMSVSRPHTNGMESHWAMLKRGINGTYHHISPKHLDRYATEFEGRHNVRPLDTADQMVAMAQGMEGKRLSYDDLIA